MQDEAFEASVKRAARVLMVEPDDISHKVRVFLNAAREEGWCLVRLDTVRPDTLPMWPKERVPEAPEALPR